MLPPLAEGAGRTLAGLPQYSSSHAVESPTLLVSEVGPSWRTLQMPGALPISGCCMVTVFLMKALPPTQPPPSKASSRSASKLAIAWHGWLCTGETGFAESKHTRVEEIAASAIAVAVWLVHFDRQPDGRA